jgi:polyhydroxybutyrate depolymerase
VLDEIDDLGFVLDLIDQLEEDVGIDTRRVYVIGISNGALFVHYLACAAQRNVTAAASVAATLIAPVHIPSCDGDRPVPIAFFLGSDDTFFPPEGRLAGNEIVHVRLLSIEESVDTWVERDGCSGAANSEDLPDVHDDGTRVRRDRYSDCTSGSEVLYYAIEGGGHTWPGSSLPSGGLVGRTSREISASEIAMRFFLDHIL